MTKRLRHRDRPDTTKTQQAMEFWSPLRALDHPGSTLIYHGWWGRCAVIVTDEVHETGQMVRHASISHPYRDPTWEEIVAVRDRFFGPETECVQFIPRRSDYVNLHPHTFHLWGDPMGRATWRLAPGGETPCGHP